MRNINDNIISFLQNIFATNENNVKQSTALQFYLSNITYAKNSSYSDLVNFVNNGAFRTRLGWKGDLRDEYNYQLSRPGKDIFIYDPDDLLLKGILNASINLMVSGASSRGWRTRIYLGDRCKDTGSI